MKHILKGWSALVVFIAAILLVGMSLMLNRHLNRALLIILAASVASVLLISWQSKPNEDSGLNVDRLEDE